MAQPPPYERQSDFTAHSTEQPDVPQEGVALDAEFNALVVTIAAILANLAQIQRDDGPLRNGLVGIDALSTAVLALINASNGIVVGAWATATVYAAGTNWVSEGTGTYICAVSHTSGTFANDLAAGKWVLIYDSAGTIPADGSVTTAKIADGAVTLAKLAVTLLDLTGTFRAQGGVAAGTASVGELLAGKRATGDAIGKIERAAKAQGDVGWKVGGGTGGVDWYLRQLASSNVLSLSDGTERVTWAGGLMDVAGAVRAIDSSVIPLTDAGIVLRFSSNIGRLDCYNYDASAWLPGQLRALTWTVVCGGITVASASSSGVNFPVAASIGPDADALGYRDVPQNPQSAAYTLALADRGKHIYSENVAGQAIVIPPNSDAAFPIGSAVAVVNRGTNSITLTQGAGVTLRWAGTSDTGDRTLAVNGLATVLKVGTNVWFVTGAGIS